VSIERDLSEYYEREAAAGVRAAMGSRGRRDDLRSVFVELLVREGRESIVEVGSGPGTDAASFVNAGVAYAGFDLAVGNARLGHTAGLVIVPASLFAPPFRPHSFDAGWTMSTFLHVPDDQFNEAVAATTSLLRPGSPLAIGLWGGRDLEFINDTDHFEPPRFFSHRSDDRAQTMLGAHGTVESFEAWPTDVGGWSYQFIVLRV
jgi:SAM-dependent methyltransferase